MSSAILLGGGSGTRMRGYAEDKILMMIEGKPVFAYSIEAFIESEVVDRLMIVYRDIEQKAVIEQWIFNNIDSENLPAIFWVQGGARRQDSVVAALRGLKEMVRETEYVYVHDLARPLIQPRSIRKMHQILLIEKAVVLACAVVDTIKQRVVEAPKTLQDLDRETLWGMETPQAFGYGLIYEAYEEVVRRDLRITDDAGAVSILGHPIAIVENDYPNPKITLKRDVDYLEFLLSKKYYAAI